MRRLASWRLAKSLVLVACIVLFTVPTVQIAILAAQAIAGAPHGAHDLRQEADRAASRGDWAIAGDTYERIADQNSYPGQMMLQAGCAWSRAGRMDAALWAAQLALFKSSRVKVEVVADCWVSSGRVGWVPDSSAALLVHDDARDTFRRLRSVFAEAPESTRRSLVACVNFLSGAKRLARLQYIWFDDVREPGEGCDRRY